VNLIINGQDEEIPHVQTLADLASWLKLPSFGSAIELNGAVIRKAEYAATALNPGDRLEIVRLVGGG
jgi:thiamine biosynthesis protein ThiS